MDSITVTKKALLGAKIPGFGKKHNFFRRTPLVIRLPQKNVKQVDSVKFSKLIS